MFSYVEEQKKLDKYLVDYTHPKLGRIYQENCKDITNDQLLSMLEEAEKTEDLALILKTQLIMTSRNRCQLDTINQHLEQKNILPFFEDPSKLDTFPYTEEYTREDNFKRIILFAKIHFTSGHNSLECRLRWDLQRKYEEIVEKHRDKKRDPKEKSYEDRKKLFSDPKDFKYKAQSETMKFTRAKKVINPSQDYAARWLLQTCCPNIQYSSNEFYFRRYSKEGYGPWKPIKEENLVINTNLILEHVNTVNQIGFIKKGDMTSSVIIKVSGYLAPVFYTKVKREIYKYKGANPTFITKTEDDVYYLVYALREHCSIDIIKKSFDAYYKDTFSHLRYKVEVLPANQDEVEVMPLHSSQELVYPSINSINISYHGKIQVEKLVALSSDDHSLKTLDQLMPVVLDKLRYKNPDYDTPTVREEKRFNIPRVKMIRRMSFDYTDKGYLPHYLFKKHEKPSRELLIAFENYLRNTEEYKNFSLPNYKKDTAQQNFVRFMTYVFCDFYNAYTKKDKYHGGKYVYPCSRMKQFDSRYNSYFKIGFPLITRLIKNYCRSNVKDRRGYCVSHAKIFCLDKFEEIFKNKILRFKDKDTITKNFKNNIYYTFSLNYYYSFLYLQYYIIRSKNRLMIRRIQYWRKRGSLKDYWKRKLRQNC